MRESLLAAAVVGAGAGAGAIVGAGLSMVISADMMAMTTTMYDGKGRRLLMP